MPLSNQFWVIAEGSDTSGTFSERAEIYDTVRDHKLSGFVTIPGDRHSFWAGYAASKIAASRVRPGWVELHHRFDLRPRSREALAMPSDQSVWLYDGQPIFPFAPVDSRAKLKRAASVSGRGWT